MKKKEQERINERTPYHFRIKEIFNKKIPYCYRVKEGFFRSNFQ